MRALMLATLMTLGFVLHALAQNGSPQENKGWITLKAGKEFSLNAPDGTKYKPSQGIDSFVGSFTNPSFTVKFDYGMYSPTLSDLRSDKRYAFQSIKIDGHNASMVTGPGEKNLVGCSGRYVAIYVPVSQEVSLYMCGCTSDDAKVKTLQAMFSSIKFLK